MKQIAAFLFLLFCGGLTSAQAEDGFQSIFDGKSLKGWDGNPAFWSVRDGAITGQTTSDNPTKGNTFCIWRAEKVDNFELKLKFRIVGGNSGIQYRSREVGKWVIGGYQADFDGKGDWTGTLYEEKGRGILAKRGNEVVIGADGQKQTAGKTTPEKEILTSVKKEDWNEYHITANGNQLTHRVNGKVTIKVTDHQEAKRAMSGLLALQLHAGPPMLVQFKDIQIKRLKKSSATSTSAKSTSAKSIGKGKKVVFMAGTRSHGYGSHEHNAGCMLLAKSLQQAMPELEVVVHRNGWPKDPKAFDGADTIVMYCDGGGRHPVNDHLEQVDALAKKGVGVVCIHYGVEVPKGKSGDSFLDWIGGYFEAHWSVNPHWDAKFTKFPKHAITRGVKPFVINDEWYYHMRFRKDMKDVTPILTAIPPAHTLSRPDGAHSGNPHVRKTAGQPQHVAWAAERPDGGRGFGFTGGHFHWNWGDPNFRKTMLNAIAWTAKIDVPENGVSDRPVSFGQLKENQDEDIPKNYPLEKYRKQLNLPDSGKTSARAPAVKPLASTPVLTGRRPEVVAKLDVDLKGARELHLVVTDGGDGFGCDWADWMEPTLIGASGAKKKLTELPWTAAAADFGKVAVNRNVSGGPLRVGGKSVAFGIGTHARSIISYKLPAGFQRLQVTCGLDNGGTDQGTCGSAASVQFHVYDKRPQFVSTTLADAPSRDAASATAGLDVAEGLEVTLVSSEPAIRSLTNLDIDHRGRIWVCEVINYRHNNGKRPEGDRILILEDKDGDGRADETKVFYQGRDIDSAMGIAVLGNKVIVSCSPNVLIFTDTDGDDRPDKKEVFFSKVGQPQHDHSAHSFLFGPDGKLYWNYGNTGKSVHDAKGKVITDMAGNQVIGNGKPYHGGMPFRCNMDGSQFEVLAHNFRNNYEVTVDSFGTLWQSDNDDDGNRGVRINYVMEFGNYGYLDELTGAGWRSPRTGMHEEIPKRHWHLRDPGVVPNMLQTGAGSPTGITVYEGRLLPKEFWDQVIHCDAGPNIVRAYPAKPQGAGYSATIKDLLKGTRDNWFRPADVCVAPDGSVFVTDWYDPGVGGHRQGDVDRGRLFRIAPPGHRYTVKAPNLETIEGAVDALFSPNLSTRYMGWTALHKRGAEAEPALMTAFEAARNPRHRARALWLLTRIKSREYVNRAVVDDNADIRIVGLRAARQLGLDVGRVVAQLLDDKSPAVRRECAIALRHLDDAAMPQLWAALAVQHDGSDRWYLEALGIGADKRWDACLAAWLSRVDNKWNTAAGKDIVWRSRAKATSGMLVELISDKQTSAAELPRYFRALDFQPTSLKEPLLLELAFVRRAGDTPERSRLIAAESIQRLGNVNVAKDEKYARALRQILSEARGTDTFVQLVSRFSVKDHYPDLLELAQARPQDSVGVAAITALLQKREFPIISKALRDKHATHVLATIEALANSRDNRITGLLMPLVKDAKRDLELRRQATRAVSMTNNGARQIIELAEKKQLPVDVMAAAAFPLNNSPSGLVREKAAKLFPLPPARNNEVLPPVSKLVSMRGDVGRGKLVFAKTGTCAKCHIVNKEGKEVGPNLSEIGGKLSRQALLESILYPSAGISHNFETYSLLLANGTSVSGVLVSQTDEKVVLKTDDAISRSYNRDDIEVMKKQKISLMPADLQKNMTTQELIDVVEYMTTLRKK